MVKLLENTRRPDITFNRNGQIRITARIARILSIATGDVINIRIEDGEYLLYVSKNLIGRHEARCYPTNRQGHNFVANSARLSRSLLDSCNIRSERASFMIGEPILKDNDVYCPIITQKPL